MKYWLKEAQARIKIAGRNINNRRYADDTTLMAESKELKSLLMKVKEESEKIDLKLNIQKMKIIWSHHFMGNRWGNGGNSVRLYFGGFKITADGDCSHDIKRQVSLPGPCLKPEHGITGWFKIGKGVHQGCILLSCLFNFFAEYIM